MLRAVDPISELLHRVQQRMILARAAQYGIVATAIATAAIVAIAAASHWFAFTPWPVTTAAVAFATILITAVVATAKTWPSHVHVARHIDGVMHLHELLASAVTCPPASDDAAARSLRAIAADAAGRIRAADVPIASPSTEVAASVGLCFVGSLIAIALVSSPRLGPQHDSTKSPEVARSTESPRVNFAARADAAEPQRPNASSVEAQSPAAESNDATEVAAIGQTAVSSQRDQGGRSRSTSDTMAAAPTVAFGANSESVGSSASPDIARTGNGRESIGLRSPNGAATVLAEPPSGGTADRVALPSTAGEIGDAARSTAADALDSGSVPDRCRDLVGAYFDVAAGSSTPRTARP